MRQASTTTRELTRSGGEWSGPEIDGCRKAAKTRRSQAGRKRPLGNQKRLDSFSGGVNQKLTDHLYPRKVKKGFTLVELSIVLVIVGLLIGGILIGQSLIESAKVNRIVRDLQQYEIATTQFYKKFRQLPGDSSSFSPAGDNNNGLQYGTGNCVGTFSADDGIQFWAHLSQAKMLSKTYRPWSPISCGGSDHDDYGNASLKDIIAPFIVIKVGSYDSYPIVVEKDLQSNLSLYFFVPAKQVLALESKMNARPLPMYPWTNIGLSNIYGLGVCANTSTNVPCSDQTALYGELLYFIEPR